MGPMRRSLLLELLLLAGLALAALPARSAAPAGGWVLDAYPNPQTDTDACGRRGVRSWVCDPDGVLPYDDANEVEGYIKVTQFVACLT